MRLPVQAEPVLRSLASSRSRTSGGIGPAAAASFSALLLRAPLTRLARMPSLFANQPGDRAPSPSAGLGR